MSIETDNIIDNDETWQVALKQLVAQQDVEKDASIDSNIDSIVLQTVVMGNNPTDAELRAHYGTPTKDSSAIAIRSSGGLAYVIVYDLSADKFFFEKLSEAN